MNFFKCAIQRSIECVPWKFLEPQLTKDMFILVNRDLDLIEAALGVVTDESTRVKAWLDGALLSKPSTQQLEVWSSSPNKLFQAVKAHPFILIQETTDH